MLDAGNHIFYLRMFNVDIFDCAYNYFHIISLLFNNIKSSIDLLCYAHVPCITRNV